MILLVYVGAWMADLTVVYMLATPLILYLLSKDLRFYIHVIRCTTVNRLITRFVSPLICVDLRVCFTQSKVLLTKAIIRCFQSLRNTPFLCVRAAVLTCSAGDVDCNSRRMVVDAVLGELQIRDGKVQTATSTYLMLL